MLTKLTIDDIALGGKRALVRVDFNVPLQDDLSIADDRRIRAALPTVEKVLAEAGRPVLMSHLGRPKGQVRKELSLDPVARRLGQLLDCPVHMAPDCVGDDVESLVQRTRPGEVVLLENLRFYSQETGNDPDFSRRLAALGDVYINDAFGTAHRAHASTQGVAGHFHQAVAGYLLKKELEYLGRAITDPVRPFTAILGGAKISGKIEVIQNLLEKVDVLLVGGGMAFTFLKAGGLEVGRSLVEEDKIDVAKDILEKAAAGTIDFQLPLDSVVAPEIAANVPTRTVSRESIPPDWMGVDIGPQTRRLFADKISSGKTIVWNGPMGVFEMPPFDEGTFEIARALTAVTAAGGITIVGGGDSAAAMARGGFEDRVSHISTGGGASLEFLAGKPLPGVEALTDRT
jgi:phosphoglycerate kinase